MGIDNLDEINQKKIVLILFQKYYNKKNQPGTYFNSILNKLEIRMKLE